jgi:HAD superfamily hydrolase (TIGR01490 family)
MASMDVSIIKNKSYCLILGNNFFYLGYIYFVKESENLKNIGAFFDIDGTIFRDSLMTTNFNKLVKHEVIDNKVYYNEVKEVEEDWVRRYKKYDEYIEILARVYAENLKGVDMNYLNFIADKTIDDSFEDIYKYSRERLAWHHQQDHCIFFISGSPDFLVSRMAMKYKATDFRGTTYFPDENNRFSGRISKMWNSENKDIAMNELVELYGIDMEKSYAYGDTNGDISMLRAVGNPIAINPNKELLMAIREDEYLANRAQIVVERKDNIYILDSNVKILD